MVEDINVPPGAHIGVIATIRQTTNPATLAVKPDGFVMFSQNPPIHVPYNWYYYESAAGYSYVQVTSELVAGIMGVRKLSCKVIRGIGPGATDDVVCFREGGGAPLEMWVCGRHLAAVYEGRSAAFQGTCATPIIRANLKIEILSISD